MRVRCTWCIYRAGSNPGPFDEVEGATLTGSIYSKTEGTSKKSVYIYNSHISMVNPIRQVPVVSAIGRGKTKQETKTVNDNKDDILYCLNILFK